MSSAARLPSWFRLLVITLALLALVRGLGLVMHRPLLAFANNYDQIRYTACLNLAPWRPGVQADAGNPKAPLVRYAFQPLPTGLCVLSSDMLLTNPPALGRALMHAPTFLLPWIPGLGVVEDGHYTPLPRSVPSWNVLFSDSPIVAGGLLLLPWLVFAACLIRRATPVARGFALMCAVGSSAVAVVSLFGDGDVEYAKHAQLTIDYVLASLCIPLAAIISRGLRVGVPV